MEDISTDNTQESEKNTLRENAEHNSKITMIDILDSKQKKGTSK